LNGYPDHWTQGGNLDDLKEHLRDLFQTFTTDQIPGIKKVEELEQARVFQQIQGGQRMGSGSCG